MGLAFLYFQHMPIPDQVASAALVGAVLGMVAQAVDLVVREEVFLMVDLAAHVAVPEAPVVGGRVHGAVVGMAAGAAAHGAGVIRIMAGAMVGRGATLIGVAAGAGVRRLCSVLCLVSQ